MREILFRGKRLSDGEWVTGYYIQPTYHWHKRGIHKDWIACGAVSNGGWLNLLQKYAVIHETVGQFTGLTDKNGKKIFEGDILEYTSYTGTGIKEVFRAIVFWDEHRWSYKVIYNNRWTAQLNNKGYTCDIYKAVAANFSEVIGNIHDNPELLTKEE